MADSEPIFLHTNKRSRGRTVRGASTREHASSAAPDDITAMFADFIAGVPVKFALIMYIIYLVINSDVFVNRVLTAFAGATQYGYASTWGVMIQGMFMVIAMIFVDGLMRQGLI